MDKDIEYRLRVSKAVVFVGDEASVRKCLRIRKECKELTRIIRVGGKGTGNTKEEGEIDDSDVIDLEEALSHIPADTQFQTPYHLTSDSPALIFFTSGTTGPPKMALHSQISYPLAHVLTGIHWVNLTSSTLTSSKNPNNLYWNMAEQGWAKASWSWFAAWNCGATLFIHDDRLPYNPLTTLNILHTYPITTLCAPPTVWRQLVLPSNQAQYRQTPPKALLHCCGAGEPLNSSVIESWKALTGGIEIYDGYGQSETILLCGNQASVPVKPGSMGRPIEGVPLRVINSTGEEAKHGDEGDIALEVQGRGFVGLFKGYIDPKTGRVDRRIKGFENGKRYYVTGDRAKRDEDGYFWFVGRGDDVIKSSGYRIGE